MRISTKSRYGVKLMLNMAENYTLTYISANVLAEQEKLPGKYVGAILNKLLKEHLIIALRGAQGGYKLSRPPEEINVLQILNVLETNNFIAPCCQSSSCCSDYGTCVTSDLWCLLQSTIDELLSNLTLADLLKMQEKKTGNPSLYLMHVRKSKSIKKAIGKNKAE